MMEIDLAVASEISERISEQTESSSPAAQSRKATAAVAKRNKRRSETPEASTADLGQALSDAFGNIGDE
tara:strand:+ start:788 stop:994 length:207 start_codon:yes stop_codon:yes gene_type:complete